LLFYNWLSGSLGRPGRRRHLFKIGLENVLIQSQHQAAALGTEGRVVIQTGDALVQAMTINTAILVDWHDHFLLVNYICNNHT